MVIMKTMISKAKKILEDVKMHSTAESLISLCEGGDYDYIIVKSTDKSVAKKEFAKAQEEDRHQNGHSYSGGLGMAPGLKFIGKTFKTENEAHDYITDNHEKWNDAWAVTVEPVGGPPYFVIGAWCSS